MFFITDIARQKNPVEPKDVVKELATLQKHLGVFGTLGTVEQPSFQRGRIRPPFEVRGR